MLGLGTGFYGMSKSGAGFNESIIVEMAPRAALFIPSGASEAAVAGHYKPGGVVMNNSFQNIIRTSFTFCCWIMIPGGTSIANGDITLLGSTGNSQDIFQLGFVNSKPIIIMESGANGFEQTTDLAVEFISDTGWVHVAFVVTDAGGSHNTTVVIYVNGSVVDLATPDSTITGTQQEAIATTNNMGLGNMANVNEFDFANSNKPALGMSEAALFTSALDADNIAAIYGFGTAARDGGAGADLTSASGDYDTQGDLAGYWKLNQASRVEAADSTSAAEFLGTLKGAAIIF